MKELWEKRYAEEEYAYGTEGNAFLIEKLSHLKPGKSYLYVRVKAEMQCTQPLLVGRLRLLIQR